MHVCDDDGRFSQMNLMPFYITIVLLHVMQNDNVDSHNMTISCGFMISQFRLCFRTIYMKIKFSIGGSQQFSLDFYD